MTAGARAASPPPAGDGDLNPELADVARLLRRLVRQAVSAARAEEGSVAHLLTSHLGPRGTDRPADKPPGQPPQVGQFGMRIIVNNR